MGCSLIAFLAGGWRIIAPLRAQFKRKVSNRRRNQKFLNKFDKKKTRKNKFQDPGLQKSRFKGSTFEVEVKDNYVDYGADENGISL